MPKRDVPTPEAEATVTVTSPDGEERTASTKTRIEDFVAARREASEPAWWTGTERKYMGSPPGECKPCGAHVRADGSYVVPHRPDCPYLSEKEDIDDV